MTGLTIVLLAAAAAGQIPADHAGARLLDLLAYSPPVNLGDMPVEAARDHVRRNAESADAWHALGQALDAAGDLAGAVDAYDKATRLPPRDVGRAFLYRDLAEARERAGDLPGALAAARVSVRSWPKSSDGLHCAGYEEAMLTRILVENGDMAGAQAFYAPLVDDDVEQCRAIGEALRAALD